MSIGKSSISRLSGGKQNPAEEVAKTLPEATAATDPTKKATASKHTKKKAETAAVPTKAGTRKKASVSEAEVLPARSESPAASVTAPEETAVKPVGESLVTAAFCAVGDTLPYWLL